MAVARNRTTADFSGSDVIFSITSEGVIPAVDGASAGALMTIITRAAATGEPLWENRTLTGTITPDGRIGAIGGVIEKAKAAKVAGKDLLLLPQENAYIVVLNESSRSMGGLRMTRLVYETVPAKEYIESTIGISVEFVDTIDEVEVYLFRTGQSV
ncbi:MAG: S16 family serine protease [Methanomicrobiales archaeon]